MTPFHRIAYDHFGTLLSVSGERYEDECWITGVCAADSQVDLFDLLPCATITAIATGVDAQLSREARQHNAEMRAEQFHYLRELASA